MSLLSLALPRPGCWSRSAGLPALYFLLRVTPPPAAAGGVSAVAADPGDERRDNSTPAAHALGLLLLRMALAALIVLAMAGPTLIPAGVARAKGPLLLLIDNVWTAAPDWPNRQAAAAACWRAPRAKIGPPPCSGLAEKPFLAMEDPGAALARLRALAPRPYFRRARRRCRRSGLFCALMPAPRWSGWATGSRMRMGAALRKDWRRWRRGRRC